MLVNLIYDLRDFEEEKDGKKTGKKVTYKQLYIDFNGALVPIHLPKQQSAIKKLLVGMIDADNRQYQNNYVNNDPVGPDESELNPNERRY